MASSTLLNLALSFFVILFLLLVVFPTKEAFFGYTLYGAVDGKRTGESCRFNAECASDICRHFDSAEGPAHTCQ